MSKLEARFPDKRVLITGATTGFGEALAHALADRSWRVAVSGMNREQVDRTVAAVDKRGGKGLGVMLDVRDKAQWIAARETLQKEWGGIDILANNAGVADCNLMIDMSAADWERLLSVNLDGVIHGCRTFAPDFVKRKSGYLLNVASVAGLLSLPEMANYNASKAAVVSLSETLSAELSAHNVGVTALCPAGFRSMLLEHAALEGRDVTKRSGIARTIQRDMQKGEHTSETVAAYALKDMEKGRLYSIPMPLYRFAWAVKRIAPHTFYKTIGWLYRNQLGPFAN
jgi:NAD(P)-dependent dehydrogenase (short-subunit alcohol dehydrogenase family)